MRLMASAYGSDAPRTTHPLPQIPECHVARTADGHIDVPDHGPDENGPSYGLTFAGMW